jgi:hypothetical protein
MKTIIKIACLFIVINTQVLIGQTPTTFTVQGVLRDATGRSLADDEYQMKFSIFPDEDGNGSVLWWEEADVNVVNGVWSYSLGEDSDYPLADLADVNYLLVEIQVAGGGYEKMLNPEDKLTKINLHPYELMVVSGTSNVFPETGNVGIGTTTPNFLLDMKVYTENARLGRAEIGAWPANTAWAYFGNQNLDHADEGNYALAQATDGSTYLNSKGNKTIRFRIGNEDKMRLFNNGHLGIGTTSSSDFKLDLQGSYPRARLGTATIGTSPYDVTYAYFGHANLNPENFGTWALLQSPGGTTYLNSTADNDLNFGIGGSTKMNIASTGKVGIGTTNPTRELHVSGTVRSDNVEYWYPGFEDGDESRAHRTPPPDWESDWFSMESQHSTRSEETKTHGFGFYPSRVKVLVSPIGGTLQSEGWIFEAGGISTRDDDHTSSYGGVIYAYNTTQVRVWLPNSNNGTNQGKAIRLDDGWGDNDLGTNGSVSNVLINIQCWK